MKTSSLPLEKHNFCRKLERWHHNLGRSLAPFLLCSLVLTSLFSLCTLYSPNSFKATLKHDADQIQSRNLVQPQKGYQNCNLFKGRWIPDLNASLYTNDSCPTIPDSKNCFKNGRMDVDFVNWRWKPDGCELPRFDVKVFLEIVRGKKMAFIGDSVARNQVDSLLCLLSKEEIPVDVYKDSDDRFRTWHFPHHNFTLMVLWSRFLVAHDEINNGSKAGSFDLHIDKVDVGWAQKTLNGIDYAIISDGHWFFRKLYLYEGGELIGCVYCNEPNITDKGLVYAFRMSFRTALRFIKNCRQCKGVTTFLRTFSPAHFEHGTWNNGGSCNRTSPQHELDAKLGGFYLELRSVQLEEIERARKDHPVKKKTQEEASFDVLDVTRVMLMRPDGHPGSYWGNKWMSGYNDCVHWCLPGPVDVWNQFLMAMLQRKSGLFLG